MFYAISALAGVIIGIVFSNYIKAKVRKESQDFYNDLHVALLDESHEIHANLKALLHVFVKNSHRKPVKD